MTALIAIAILYLLYTQVQVVQKSVGTSLTKPVAKPLHWPPGPGEPGFVTIGNQPAPANYSLGNTQTAITASSLAGSAIGGTLGVSSALGAGAGGAGAVIGTTAATALPIIGIGVALVGTILGIIGKHHAEMVAKEASELNQAVPLTIQRYVLIMQATVRKEVTSTSQAQGLLVEAVSDYYAIVKPMRQGMWPLPGWPGISSNDGWELAREGKPDPANAKRPGTCNAGCVVGHWMEIYASFTLRACDDCIKGNHGILRISYGGLPDNVAQVPHSGFVGMPKVEVLY